MYLDVFERDTSEYMQDTCRIHAGYMQDTSGYVLYRKIPPICIGNPPSPVEEGRLGLQWELVGVRQDSGER
jgi:hypothetical protein